MSKSIQLIVSESSQLDIGKLTARVSLNILNKLGIKSGDYIKIKGERETIARVRQLDSEFDNQDIIKMDGDLRHNSQSQLSEKINIQPINLKPAKKIHLALVIPKAPENIRLT